MSNEDKSNLIVPYLLISPQSSTEMEVMFKLLVKVKVVVSLELINGCFEN